MLVGHKHLLFSSDCRDWRSSSSVVNRIAIYQGINVRYGAREGVLTVDSKHSMLTRGLQRRRRRRWPGRGEVATVTTL